MPVVGSRGPMMDMLFADQKTGPARGSHSRSTLTDMALSLVARAAGSAGLASALNQPCPNLASRQQPLFRED
jgi:hypothetical protein